MNPCVAAVLKKRDSLPDPPGSPEMFLLVLLVLLHDEKTHRSDASFAELARTFGCNERNIKLLVKKLKDRGLIDVERYKVDEGHARNTYGVKSCFSERPVDLYKRDVDGEPFEDHGL